MSSGTTPSTRPQPTGSGDPSTENPRIENPRQPRAAEVDLRADRRELTARQVTHAAPPQAGGVSS